MNTVWQEYLYFDSTFNSNFYPDTKTNGMMDTDWHTPPIQQCTTS